MTKEQIGSILKELRLRTGMTQKEVAELLGRKQPIIGHWETGYAQPDANTLFTLCDIYGTTVDAAFGFKKKDLTISKDDLKLIEKYQSLDLHGKELVTLVIDKELERSTAEKETIQTPLIRVISYYHRLASAGTGQILFDTPPTKEIEIPDIPKYRKVGYAIGVDGDSMEPVYHDGDILLVEMTEDVNIGEIGIFYVDGKSYVKKRGNNELISLNPKYNNISVNETSKCMGKVIGKLN